MKKVWLLIKKIISDLVILILAIFFIIAIYGFINIKILKKDYVNLFGYTYFDIITGSMEDTINVHDMVFVKITEDAQFGIRPIIPAKTGPSTGFISIKLAILSSPTK